MPWPLAVAVTVEEVAVGSVPVLLVEPSGATEVGTTALDEAEAVDVPPALDAVTVNV